MSFKFIQILTAARLQYTPRDKAPTSGYRFNITVKGLAWFSTFMMIITGFMPVFMLPTRADVNEPSEDIRRRYYADGVTDTPDNGFWHQGSADKGIQCLSMSESRLFRAEDLIHLISVSLLLRLKPWPGNFSPLTKIWFYELLIYFSPQWFNKHSNI